MSGPTRSRTGARLSCSGRVRSCSSARVRPASAEGAAGGGKQRFAGWRGRCLRRGGFAGRRGRRAILINQPSGSPDRPRAGGPQAPALLLERDGSAVVSAARAYWPVHSYGVSCPALLSDPGRGAKRKTHPTRTAPNGASGTRFAFGGGWGPGTPASEGISGALWMAALSRVVSRHGELPRGHPRLPERSSSPTLWGRRFKRARRSWGASDRHPRFMGRGRCVSRAARRDGGY